MRFYIYLNGQWIEKKVNLLAVQEDVKDETLDTASLNILADDRAEAYPSRTPCKIVEKGTTKYFYTGTDMVSAFSLSPLTYKHALSLIQTTRELSHHILPNMVITKPREKTERVYFSTTNTLNIAHYASATKPTTSVDTWNGFLSNDYAYNEGSPITPRAKSTGSRYWEEPYACSVNEKVEKAVLRLRFSALHITGRGVGSNLTGEIVNMKRTFKSPSWLQPYIQIYHTPTNISQITDDGQIQDRVEIATYDLTTTSWKGEYMEIALNQATIDTINSYGDGYICIDLKTKVVGEVPGAFGATASAPATFYAKLYDRLFTDVDEYKKNGYQKTMLSMELVFTYKRTFLYDTLQRIIDRQQCEYSQGNKKPLFKLPTSGADYDTLTKVESPEFTFTNQTVFEAVSQVLSTIDALPEFVTAQNDDGSTTNTLKIDYLNERGEKITSTTVAGYTSGFSESKYVNGLVSNYQRAELVRTFPTFSNGNDNYVGVRLKSYGVPELQDFAMTMDKPIKYIKRLEVKTKVGFLGVWPKEKPTWAEECYRADCYVEMPIDVSPFTFEESVYSSALSDQGKYPSPNHNIRLQMNCLHFSKGSKYIDLGNKQTNEWNLVYLTFWRCWQDASYRKFGVHAQNCPTDEQVADPFLTFVYPSQGEYYQIFYRCEYASDFDGRVRVESPVAKADGEMNVSASGASIDLGKLGVNMLGISMRTGVPTMTCNQVMSTWENRILKGQTIERFGHTWVANKCDYQTIGDGIIKGTIEFTRDFNGLSQRIALDQNKRFSNISESIVEKCEAIVMNYATFYPSLSIKSDSGFNEENKTPFTGLALGGIMMKGFGSAYSGESKNVDFARYYLEPSTSGVRDIYIPLAVYGAGNCICFETAFDSPISAGIRMEVKSDSKNDKWWKGLQTITGTKQYFGKDVKCADSEGYADTVSIDYVMGDKATFSHEFPIVFDSKATKVGTLKDLKFRKMPNEIFALNYEIALLSRFHGDKEVFFGKSFMDCFKEQKPTHKCFVWFGGGDSHKYTPMDTKAKGHRIPSPLEISYRESDLADDGKSKDIVIEFKLSVSAMQRVPPVFTSFAIADENQNILVACNWDNLLSHEAVVPCLHFKIDSERIQ